MNPAANLAPLPVTGDRSRAAFDKVILRLVKGGPERAAIAAGQVDAVMDAKTGKVILFPEARRALEERESQLHDLVELAADWIWQQDEHFRFAARSGAAVSESGLEDADVIGRTLWELPFDNMSADDWQTHRNQLEWRSSFRDLELRYVDRNDNLRYVSMNGAPVFDEQDHFRGYRGTARDITTRKHYEAVLQAADRDARSALDALPIEISVLDAAGTVLMANTACNRPTIEGGRLGAAACVGVNYLALCDNATGNERADASAIANGIRNALAGDGQHFTHEYPCDSPGGQTWYVLNVRGYRDDGRTRAVMSREAITDRKRAEQLLGLDFTATSAVPGTGCEPTNRVSVANRLLAALPYAEYTRLLSGMEPVLLPRGQLLHAAGAPIRHVYFPLNGLVAVLATAAPNRTVGADIVGQDGMIGISVALGIDISPVRSLVQSAGTAMRMGAAEFRKQLLMNAPLQRILNRYAHAMIVQLAQAAACNSSHDLNSRLARWLLVAFERGQCTELRITQGLMAQMLGVRRVAISGAAGVLQRRNLIDCQRGTVQLLNRRGLEKAACSCYRIIKDRPL